MQWRLWGKFKNSLNCHNSEWECTQDRVVLIGAIVWFSRSANLTPSFKYPLDDPCCHGNKILDKTGYTLACV